jgi:hypothetical protein
MSDENIIYVNGKAADIKAGIVSHIESGKYVKAGIFGFPRTVTAEYVSYAALEEVKDGIFYSGKYESRMCMYNPPHIIVMANFPPDTSKMSKDRWVIKNLGKDDGFHAASYEL